MNRSSWVSAACVLAVGAGCNITKLTVNTTSKIAVLAAPATEMEADYELAARAMPGALKQLEGFHMADPSNKRLTGILAQAYCNYAAGFIEDEFEIAEAAGDREQMENQARRATNSFIRCMNYGLEVLGGDWQKALLADLDAVRRKAASAGDDQRMAMMWVGIGLGGAVNYNRDDIALVAQLPKARVLLERVVALDDAGGDAMPQHRALPHIALGSMHATMSPAMGGDHGLAARHWARASEVTGGKHLLAKVLMARRLAVARQDRALFHQTMTAVLRTDPAVWPQQRLINEIAHRRARRYLKREKEWF